MQSFFWHLLTAPRVYAKLMAEIDAAVRTATIPASGNIEWLEAQKLEYFQACLKEAMRIRPAVGLSITRYVPPEGADIEGHHFEGGTRIAANGWVLHRDQATFGEDADFYRPERWLDDAENAKVMERYMFQVRARIFCYLFRYFMFAVTNLFYSLAVVATSALAGTWRCWRSTRSSPDC